MMDLQRVNAYMSKVEESEKNVLPHEGKRLKTGLDLGTAYIVLVVLDENNQPVACEKRAASVLRDGVVVDYSGACRIVRELKEKLEERLGEELIDCAIAMPAGTESSTRTHQYVAESAGFEVTNIVDEPTAANAIYQISDGVVVDIGGGTTPDLRSSTTGRSYRSRMSRPAVRTSHWCWPGTIMYPLQKQKQSSRIMPDIKRSFRSCGR